MTYNETLAIVYRIVSAYPSQAKHFTNDVIEGMAREWQIGLEHLPADGVMEAITRIITEQKWMPSLSEVIEKILDVQYGTNEMIVGQLNRKIQASSDCIIFGQVTQDQIDGYEKLTDFEKRIIHSPYEFNVWLNKDYEWKEARVMRVKREIQHGNHKTYLTEGQGNQIEQGFIKALAEKNNYGN